MEWISVEDDLPKDDNVKIVWLGNNLQWQEGYYDGKWFVKLSNQDFFHEGSIVTHWLEINEPKEDEDYFDYGDYQTMSRDA